MFRIVGFAYDIITCVVQSYFNFYKKAIALNYGLMNFHALNIFICLNRMIIWSWNMLYQEIDSFS